MLDDFLNSDHRKSESGVDAKDTSIVLDDKYAEEILSQYFDKDFYCERYEDIDERYVNPLGHFCVFGWKEGRDPCAWFSTRRYLSRNLDVAEKSINPFLHYILYGRQEGRNVWPAEYCATYDLEIDSQASFVADKALRDLVALPPRACEYPLPAQVGCLKVHWVIPDFTIGSGGHMTIFRLIRWLEIAGHDCSIWITDPSHHRTPEAAYEDILRHFQTIRGQVAFAENGLMHAQGDAIVATGWQTVAHVLHATSFSERFYLVQDYEPAFYAMGSHALAAAWTYTQELACICASPWLARRLRETYGRWTTHFWLAYDKAIYYPDGTIQAKQPERPLRIAVYARFATARRAVELVMLALEHLSAQGMAFHVDLFGEDLLQARAPFSCTSHGILEAVNLADLYRQADIGICFSSTNYSLVPQEMMACGLPVVEIDGDSTRTIFPDGVVTLTGPHPLSIARDLEVLMTDPKRREQQAEAALRWISQFDWESAAKVVEQAVLDRLRLNKRVKMVHVDPGKHTASRSRSKRVNIKSRREITSPTVKASVCIPTFNGGSLLHDVVERVRSQRTPWPFELVLIDSSSTDGSIEHLELLTRPGTATAATTTVPTMHLHHISQSEFQHGRTRNLCASLARGEFIAFLTQDALPADEFWLYHLVSVLERFPRAAGAFGRHLPWPSSSPFVRRDITRHFEDLLHHPLVLSRDTKPSQGMDASSARWRQVLHYYSDNNSCLKRSAWETIPYPEVDYGEDQAWAESIISLGYDKVHVPTASVFHSHDYTPTEATLRAETEAYFFKTFFGYSCYDQTSTFQSQIAAMNNADIAWAMRNGVSEEDLARRLLQNRATLYGHFLGIEKAKTSCNTNSG